MDKPILELYQLDSEDVITASAMVPGDDNNPNKPGGEGGDIVWNSIDVDE